MIPFSDTVTRFINVGGLLLDANSVHCPYAALKNDMLTSH